MVKNKIHSRIINSRIDSKSHNYLYRLVLSQRFLVIIGLVFLVAIIFPLARTYSQRRMIEKEIQDVKNQISNYEKQNQELTELISYLQSDQSLEEQARLNLNLKKPGEGVIVIKDKGNNVSELNTTSTPQTLNNLIKWWGYFFN